MDTFQKFLPENEPRLVPGTQNTYLPVEQNKKDWPAVIEDASLVNDNVLEEQVVEEKAPEKENVIEAEDNNLIKE